MVSSESAHQALGRIAWHAASQKVVPTETTEELAAKVLEWARLGLVEAPSIPEPSVEHVYVDKPG